jgi:hypothetical protein
MPRGLGCPRGLPGSTFQGLSALPPSSSLNRYCCAMGEMALRATPDDQADSTRNPYRTQHEGAHTVCFC